MSGSNLDHPTQFGKPDAAQFASGHSVEAWVDQLTGLRNNLWEDETPGLVEALRGDDLLSRAEALAKTRQILGRMAKWNEESSKVASDKALTNEPRVSPLGQLDTHPRTISWPLAETVLQLSNTTDIRAKRDLSNIMSWLNGGPLPMPIDRTLYSNGPWYDSSGRIILDNDSSNSDHVGAKTDHSDS